MNLNESIIEDAALTWFGELGYAVGHGPQLALGEPAAERDSFSEVVLVGRLREAIRRLNPAIPEEGGGQLFDVTEWFNSKGDEAMKNEPQPNSDLILYQTEEGRTRIQCRFEDETVWLTQEQMAELSRPRSRT